MPRKKPAPSPSRRLIAIAALVTLAAAAFYTNFRRTPAPVIADLNVTGLRFIYHPIDKQRLTGTGGETQFLAGAPFDMLSVRSFDTLEAPTAVVSLRDRSANRWDAIRDAGRVVIRSKDTSSRAIFSAVKITTWTFGETPTITMGFPRRQPVLNALIEGNGIELSFAVADSIEFQCQLCAIDGVEPRAETAPLEVRLSELNRYPLTASSKKAMTLEVIPGPAGFGDQQFHISEPWFCGGDAREATSTVLGGTVVFPGIDRKEEVSGVLRLAADSTFLMTALAPTTIDEKSALKLRLEGLATRAESASACNESGETFLPTVLEALRKKPVVIAGTSAFALFFAWLGFFDTLRNAWARTRPKESGK